MRKIVVPLDHLISDDKEERRHQRTSLPLPVKVMIKRSPALTTSRWSYERQGILLKMWEWDRYNCRREDRKIYLASANQKTVCFSKHMVDLKKRHIRQIPDLMWMWQVIWEWDMQDIIIHKSVEWIIISCMPHSHITDVRTIVKWTCVFKKYVYKKTHVK